jgi:phage shock protein PspC (stress-responsive transcriptional regulator)
MPKKPKQLKLSQNKLVGGVVAGFAEYFNVDTTILRILVAAVLVATGFFPGVFLYLLAWFIMMYADRQPSGK